MYGLRNIVCLSIAKESELVHLIQILLPVSDNEGAAFSGSQFARVQAELTERFGGATAYLRAPAQGTWKSAEGGSDRDQVVIFETLTEQLDRQWWADYRRALEARYRQAEVLIRATEVEQL